MCQGEINSVSSILDKIELRISESIICVNSYDAHGIFRNG